MAISINSISMVNPRSFQLTNKQQHVLGNKMFTNTSYAKEVSNISNIAAYAKSAGLEAHDTKTADLTNIKEDIKTLAGGVVKNPTPTGILTTILQRTIGVPSIADADKVIADTLKDVKDPSLVKNIEDAWKDWKTNYYKKGNISNGEAFKAGINLIPTMGRGICNGVLETGAKVTQDVLGTEGAQAVSNTVNSVANGIKTIGDTIVAPFSGLINTIKGKKNKANAAFYKVWQDVKTTGKSLKNTVVSTGKYLGKTIMNFSQNPFTSIGKLAQGVGKGLKTTLKSVGGAAKKIGKGVKKGVKKLWKKIFG